MIKLTDEQMEELTEKFFDRECYAYEGDCIFLDGHVDINTILAAADWIRENGKEEK